MSAPAPAQYPTLLAHDRAALSRLEGKRFLITGGQGMLGRSFARLIRQVLPTATVVSTSKTDLDVRQEKSFQAYAGEHYDFLIHCAALVDADYCEEHEAEGFASIVDGTNNALSFARQCGATLLYPQSFLIYDGSEFPIDEDTDPRPMGAYGRLKLLAEEVVGQTGVPSLVIRMGGFFGGGPADNNFVGRIVPHLAKILSEGKQSIEIGDRVWQPTFTDDLAANCLLLLATQKLGTYCMASHGSASFHDLTQEITRVLGIDRRIEVRRIDAALLAAREKARRPLSAVMSNKRLRQENLDRQRAWQASLADYLNQPYFRNMFA